MVETLTPSLPDFQGSGPSPFARMLRYVDLLPLSQDADECLDLLIIFKLFRSRAGLCDEQLAEALMERRRTGLSLEHLIVKLGFCDIQAAMQVLAERRRIYQTLCAPAVTPA